jgi:hypothetical protein
VSPRLHARAVFPLQFTSLPAACGWLYLAFGLGIAQWNGAALPISLDPFGLMSCMLWIAPEPGYAALIPHAGSSRNHPLAIPGDPALAGTRVAMQAFVFDAASPNGLGAVTNAAVATLH